jgi:tetratricopeptide (TPR) repeat protein
MVAGELAAQDGKLKEAEALLTRAVALQPAFFPEVIDIYLRKVKRPDMARKLAGDDYQRLEELARAYGATAEYAGLVEETRASALASLRQRANASDANAYELAALARIELAAGKVQPAIELFQRALVQDYRQVEWRLDLARALAASDQVEAAIHEVRICLRLRAQYGPAMQLLEELIKRRERNPGDAQRT